MKKAIAGLLLLSCAVATFAQETVAVKNIRGDLINKSKNQKTTSYIMLIGGAAAVAAGSAMFAENLDIISEETNSGETGGAILIEVGGASMIGSIFLFSAAARNKRDGYTLAMSFKTEKGIPDIIRVMKPTYFPGISFKLSAR